LRRISVQRGAIGSIFAAKKSFETCDLCAFYCKWVNSSVFVDFFDA
jgi:hypothetical protein